jgi:hypothetical protein
MAAVHLNATTSPLSFLTGSPSYSQSLPSIATTTTATTAASVGLSRHWYLPSINPRFDEIQYDALVTNYIDSGITEKTKPGILGEINTIFTGLKSDIVRKTDELKRAELIKAITELKKKFDVKFSKDVNCNYRFFGSTPNSYGCDLRELIFNIDGSVTPGGEALLNTFKELSTLVTPPTWHILTDADDTLFPNDSHGTYISGVDKSWPQKMPYPGVIEFYKQFHALSQTSDYSTVLSATPGIIKSSRHSSTELKQILGDDFGFIQGIDRKRELFRQIGNIMKTVWKKGILPESSFYADMAMTKYARFCQYARIFPERKFIWIGDSGQGDAIAGLMMLNDPNLNVKVFIHQVGEITVVDERIHYFKTYLDLANIFTKLGIFKDEIVNRISDSIATVCGAITTSTATHEQREIHCTPPVHSLPPKEGGRLVHKSKSLKSKHIIKTKSRTKNKTRKIIKNTKTKKNISKIRRRRFQ